MLFLLLMLGLVAAAGGGWVALNIRGAAVSLEQRQGRNLELRRQAQGRLDSPDLWMTVTGFRWLGSAVGLGGMVLVLLMTLLLTGA
ncbi:hypothetical protein ACH4F6_35920 [Streptomyces sp. NPDC017936]|uniref:hypothetical protein n=1 Tax=Streptomyces sp. NPDC017936 TaxID=3365016 RepID=UPI003789973D